MVVMTVGARAVIRRGPGDWRIICATCRGGGWTPYRTQELALASATRASANPCPVKMSPCRMRGRP